jgi:hypothetical protein
MARVAPASIVIALVAAEASPARADEQLFGYAATSETIPGQGTELYLEATDRAGKGRGRYRARDYRGGIERGISDELQAAAYLQFGSHEIRELAPAFAAIDRSLRIQGLQFALKQVILSPYKDGIGLAVALEPAYSRIARVSGRRHDQYDLALRLIVQETFLEDQLIWATNLLAGPRWERGREARAFTTSWRLDAITGLSYRVAPRWFVAVEGRYESLYRDLSDRTSFAIFAGPALHYATQQWWATLSVQPQLHGRHRGATRSRDLIDHEKREIRVKVGINF